MTEHAAQDNGAKGMILVIVLWATAMMTVIVVALSALSQKSITLAGVETDRLRSELALEAGLAAGVGAILAVRPEERVLLDGKPFTAEIGNGRQVELQVMNAAGLVDINRADGELIAGLLRQLRIAASDAETILSAIASLREAEQQGAGGSQKQASGQASETGETKPLPPLFFAMAQVYGLEGADRRALDKLLPFITLYSSDGKVNPMAAPQMVMDAIPGLSPADRAALRSAAQRRQSQGAEVQEILERSQKFLSIGDSRVFVIGVKLLGGTGVIAGSRMNATIILDDAGKMPFQVLAWSW